MRIAIAGDSVGVPLVEVLAPHIAKRAKTVVTDLSGPPEGSTEYYANVADRLASAILRGEYDRGVLCCGTGIGMCISANKVPGIRAVMAIDTFTVKSSREHNNANVLCLGGQYHGPGLARHLVEAWLATPYAGGRHEQRVAKIHDIEKRYLKES